jgi:hypothetical protein
MEVECSMLYELVLGLTRGSYSLISCPNASIGYVPSIVKDKEIVQQARGDLEIGNAKLVHQLQANIKQDVVSGHFFF